MISVVIPTFNSERFVPDCFATIRKQTVLPSQIIFVDDASSDRTVAEIRSAAASFPVQLKVIELKQNRGPSNARNLGMEVAEGEWIAFLDCDDLWEPQHLESLLKSLAESGATFAYSGLIVLDLQNDTKLNETDFSVERKVPHDLYRESFIMPSQVMFRRSLLDSGVRFDDRIRHGEDADFWISLHRAGASMVCTGQRTFIYRKHGNTPSQNAEKCAASSAYRMIKYLDYGDFPKAKLWKWALGYQLAAVRLGWRNKPLRALGHLVCVATGRLGSLI